MGSTAAVLYLLAASAMVGIGERNPDSGGMITPVHRQPAISLAEQTVEIDVLPGYLAVVDARYRLVASKSVGRIYVAFPVRHGQLRRGCTLHSVQVNGTRVKSQIAEGAVSMGGRHLGPSGATDLGEPPENTRWYIFRVGFRGSPPQAAVRVRYLQWLSDEASARLASMTYVLTSAPGWSGAIGRSRFTFRVRGPWHDAILFRASAAGRRLRAASTSLVEVVRADRSAQWPEAQWPIPGALGTLTLRALDPDVDLGLDLVRDVGWNLWDGRSLGAWREPVRFRRGEPMVWRIFARHLQEGLVNWDEEDATIDWDPPTRTLTLTCGERLVRLRTGSRSMVVNGETSTLPAAPYVAGSSVVVPLVPVARALGIKVFVDEKHRRVCLARQKPYANWREVWPLELRGAQIGLASSHFLADGHPRTILHWLRRPGSPDVISVTLDKPNREGRRDLNVSLRPGFRQTRLDRIDEDKAVPATIFRDGRGVRDTWMVAATESILSAAGVRWRLVWEQSRLVPSHKHPVLQVFSQ